MSGAPIHIMQQNRLTIKPKKIKLSPSERRIQQRFQSLSAFAHQVDMHFVEDFIESPFADFDKDGLMTTLLRRMYEQHLGLIVTKREADILIRLASGFSKEKITDELEIGHDAWHQHINNLRKKFASVNLGDDFNFYIIASLMTNRIMGQLI